MNDNLHRDMIEATRLTRAGRLREATAVLQRALPGGTAPGTQHRSRGDSADAPEGRGSLIIDLIPETIEVTDPQPSSRTAQPPGSGRHHEPTGTAEETAWHHVPEALRHFVEWVNRTGSAPGRGGMAEPRSAHAPTIAPESGQFVARSYSNEAGSLAYKLYIPSGYREQALPLVVMLHGCTQSPDDFAAGTGMNALAEEHTCLVVYPAQSAAANASKCWNWFSPGNQQRGQGEPSLIAGITREVMRDHLVDPRRVYVAGLSAGGAAASIMGTTYPDLYAAIGVHSGLACGVASNLPSAFAAMQQGDAASMPRSDMASAPEGSRRIVPTIVFHGDQDATVHPRNGDDVIAQSRATTITTPELQTIVQHGRVPGGHAYSRTLHVDSSGQTILEQWVIHGAGHAWSGGSSAGSYTDPRGPDAAREMLRFFFEHQHPIGSQ
jgi:poly(hydroxyalkanoate) depolymerase family esterase